MILVMKKNFNNHKIYIGMFTISIVNCMKKNHILAKTFRLLSSSWFLFFKLSQILGPIQVLANSVKKYGYNNLAFEVYAKNN